MAIEIQELPTYGHGEFLQFVDNELVTGNPVISLPFICGDRSTAIEEPEADIYSDVMPFDFVCLKIVAYLTNPASTGTFEVDVKKNGVSVLSTKITIDAGEKSSVSAAVAAVLSIMNWTAGDEVIIAVTDEADGTGRGLRVHFIGYQAVAVGADIESPSVPTGLSATMESDTEINVDWDASTDNVAVTGYFLQRATNSGFTTGVTNIALGAVTSYADTGLTPETTYYYRVKARDLAGNLSAYSTSANATTDETPYVPFWTALVDAKHEEVDPTNALRVIATGESGFSGRVVTLAENGYVEMIWSMDGNWDFLVGRAMVGENNGGGYGIWYDDGSNSREVVLTPAIDDVFRFKRIAGNNCEVYQNGVLKFTSASADFTTHNILVKTYSTSVNEELAKPVIA